ncbi:branched-chain amino acid transport system permease protein [Streptosporangium album]|uniref:Branched-chain amino acid transport system permease protein n=1 Tax=Streptosporangium album TaxID=47479 RepID=A0A7W7WET9_9ACTN|nr:branched-chain amino acid ABC transporter permease [Streptosporangium album]MBB4944188.1 branched-chain amino acid transport system permease protein [Streptosporangium album]
MERFLALLLAGLSSGAVYALVASGIVLVHKASGAVNFAQGDLLTLGAYVYLVLTAYVAPLVAVILAIVVLFLVGGAIERIVFVPLRNKPRLTVAVATFGIALAIEAGLTVWRGSDPQSVPSAFGSGSVSVFGALLPVLSLWTIAITALVFGVLYAIFQYTQIGRMVRALAADREVAVMYGVSATVLNFLTFGLSGALAALGGVLLAPALALSPFLGFSIVLYVFAAVTIGGFDSMGGVAVAAVVLGVAQQLLTGYVSSSLTNAYPYLIMLVLLLIRPTGLARPTMAERY